jgi:hypothetical protein
MQKGTKEKEVHFGRNVSAMILKEYFADHTKRITLLSGSSFMESNRLVINFLNQKFGTNPNLVALKGLNPEINAFDSVFMEFFFDSHPKAVKISEELLVKVGIQLPENGIIDTQNIPVEDRAKLKEKILKLKKFVFTKKELAEVEELEKRKFATLGDKKKQAITPEFTIYANAHIYDLEVLDKSGKVVIVPTYQNSPVISKECRILGVGPITMINWAKVINNSDALIILGSTEPYQGIIENYEGETFFGIG